MTSATIPSSLNSQSLTCNQDGVVGCCSSDRVGAVDDKEGEVRGAAMEGSEDLASWGCGDDDDDEEAE